MDEILDPDYPIKKNVTFADPKKKKKETPIDYEKAHESIKRQKMDPTDQRKKKRIDRREKELFSTVLLQRTPDSLTIYKPPHFVCTLDKDKIDCTSENLTYSKTPIFGILTFSNITTVSFSVVPTPPDGNCFFHTIIQALWSPSLKTTDPFKSMKQLTIEQLRTKVVDRLFENGQALLKTYFTFFTSLDACFTNAASLNICLQKQAKLDELKDILKTKLLEQACYADAYTLDALTYSSTYGNPNLFQDPNVVLLIGTVRPTNRWFRHANFKTQITDVQKEKSLKPFVILVQLQEFQDSRLNHYSLLAYNNQAVFPLDYFLTLQTEFFPSLSSTEIETPIDVG